MGCHEVKILVQMEMTRYKVCIDLAHQGLLVLSCNRE